MSLILTWIVSKLVDSLIFITQAQVWSLLQTINNNKLFCINVHISFQTYSNYSLSAILQQCEHKLSNLLILVALMYFYTRRINNTIRFPRCFFFMLQKMGLFHHLKGLKSTMADISKSCPNNKVSCFSKLANIFLYYTKI